MLCIFPFFLVVIIISGEMTDKGYVNQSVATLRRAAEIAVLYAGAPNAAVAVR